MPITLGQSNPDWTFEETILALDVLQQNNFKVPGKTSTEVKALSKLLQSLPIHFGASRNAQFRNVDGVCMKFQNLLAVKHEPGEGRLRFSAMDKRVLDEYWNAPAEVRLLADAFKAGAKQLTVQEVDACNQGDESFPEGRLLTAIHKLTERNPKLRKLVLARERKKGLACQACGRGPALTSRGPEAEASMYEAHHLMPLSTLGPTRTRASDLALLCAVCHRLIHQLIRLEKRWCTVEDLRAAVTR